jgi:hypothetical protein
MNPMRWIGSNQGRTLLSLVALLAAAPLLGRPDGSVGTLLGWALLVLSLVLPLWSRLGELRRPRR